jgi:putative redox protein
VDTVRVRYARGRQFVGWDGSGHGVVMDAPVGPKGEGTGPRPIELVLYGLAGCTGMDVVSVMEKKRQPLSTFEVVVTAKQREDDYPHFYEEIHIEYVAGGEHVTSEALEHAIQLSQSKYCSVRGMFGEQVKVTTSYCILADA